MKKILFKLLELSITMFFVFYFILVTATNNDTETFFPPEKSYWEVQAVDTMKYSRDLAGEMLADPAFDAEIEKQVRAVARTGATHLALGTPYDEQFFPFLKRWVEVARQYNLNIWFRGNWSGWEGWFGFKKKLSRQDHIKKTENFILNHPTIFTDGDIFSSCPECENGGPGDPRQNNNAVEYRKFIIEEYAAVKRTFSLIKKNVRSNFFSMNGDVARLIMDKETTQALDGLVVIDHYVATPEKLVQDIKDIAEISGGQVMLGEWGVPIPDIHGEMNDDQRAEWIERALDQMSLLDNKLIGMNYWLAVGGDTALWPKGSEISKVSEVIRKYYSPQLVFGRVINEINQPIKGAQLSFGKKFFMTDDTGKFEGKIFRHANNVSVNAVGYYEKNTPAIDYFNTIVLEREKPSYYFEFLLWLRRMSDAIK